MLWVMWLVIEWLWDDVVVVIEFAFDVGYDE